MDSVIRAEFPVLSTCVYLNSNSTGAKPRGAEEVLHNYWQTLRTWRDDAWGGWLEELAGYTDALAAFLGAPPGTVVTDINVSTLLGRLGTCFDFSGSRNRVLTSDHEFPTVPFIWRGFERYGAAVDVVGFTDDEIMAGIDERTLLVCVTHASFRTGALIDLGRIVARAHEVGALVATDACQTVGVLPVDVRAMGVDFVLGCSTKWLCGVHSAFLYVRQELIPTLRPAATGWFAGADPLTFGPVQDWAADAARLGGGTPVPLAAMISRVGLDLLASVGSDAIRAHSVRCTERIIELADEAGIEVLTPREPERRGGVVSLRFPGDRSACVALAERGMICSWRDGLRVAPHVYNTLDEIDVFMAELKAVR